MKTEDMIPHLRAGHEVARTSWNGTFCIYLVQPIYEPIDEMHPTHRLIEGVTGDGKPWVEARTHNETKFFYGSGEDLIADDWEILQLQTAGI